MSDKDASPVATYSSAENEKTNAELSKFIKLSDELENQITVLKGEMERKDIDLQTNLDNLQEERTINASLKKEVKTFKRKIEVYFCIHPTCSN